MTITSLGAVLVNHKISSGEQTEEEILQLSFGDVNWPHNTFSGFKIPWDAYSVVEGEVCSYSYDRGTATFLSFYTNDSGGAAAGTADAVWYGTAPVADTHYTIKTFITSNKGKNITITTDLYITPAEYKKPVYNNQPLRTVPAYPSTSDGSLLGCFTGTSPNGYSLVYSIVGASPGLSGLTMSEYKACFSIDSVTGCLTVLDAEAVFSIPGDNSSLVLSATDTGPYKLSDTAVISLRVA